MEQCSNITLWCSHISETLLSIWPLPLDWPSPWLSADIIPSLAQRLGCLRSCHGKINTFDKPQSKFQVPIQVPNPSEIVQYRAQTQTPVLPSLLSDLWPMSDSDINPFKGLLTCLGLVGACHFKSWSSFTDSQCSGSFPRPGPTPTDGRAHHRGEEVPSRRGEGRRGQH